MRQKLLLTTLATLFTALAVAQSLGDVTLKLLDARDNTALMGVTVSLTDSKNKSTHGATNYQGECTIEALPYDRYQLHATYIGCDTLRQDIVVDERAKNLGTILMRPRAVKMDKVEINATAIRTSQSGDTVIYNADAYKVAADATMDGLLGKMPGIKVDSDGEVEAQGETVQKVYLDGKEFFGDDVALAVKNIPADIIAKVEVFNKLSDNAEFTGFDDGDSYKALNFITRSGMNSGHFGKFVAGYAHEGLYQTSANYNYFRDNHRITFIGGYNNMNIRNFGQMDLTGSGRRGNRGGGTGSGSRSASGGGSYTTGSSGQGLATIGSFGLNYGGQFKDDKLKMEASYFYNLSDSETIRTTDAQYITEEDDPLSYFYTDAKSGSDNYNHRVNGRIEYKPNARHSLMIRPLFSWQETGSLSYSETEYTEGEDKTYVSDKSSDSDTEKMAYNISNRAVYRALIGNKGRNIMVMAYGKYSVNDSETYKKTENTVDPEENSTNYKILDETMNYSLSSSVMYSEPIMERSAMLTLKYSINHQYSDADYWVYDYENALQAFNDYHDADRSNVYNSNNTTQSVTAGFMYSRPKNLTLNADVSVQRTDLINEQEVPVATPSGDYTYDNILYSLNLRKTFNPTNSLRVNLRARTSNPSITDLQEVLVDIDPTDLAYGNGALQPSYANSLSMTYNRSNIMMGRTFTARMSASLTNNYIGEETVMNLDPDEADAFDVTLPDGSTETLTGISQYARPINLDGMWSTSMNFSYGMPVGFLSSNLNLDGAVSYSESPSRQSHDGSTFYDITKQNSTYRAGATLGSNINENVDFTLTYSGSISVTDYRADAAATTSARNSYFTNAASAKFKFVFLGGFTLFGDATFTQYAGITDSFNEQYILCNLSIGRKLFKNNRGEISLNANDIFNQSERFTRSITDTYIANIKTNTIGRYYGVKFTFDLRKFKGSNANVNIDDNTGGYKRERPSGGMGMGRM